jgi:hypothetical protein
VHPTDFSPPSLFIYLESKSKFSRHGQIEENPPERLDEPYGRHFEGDTGNCCICLVRYTVSDQTRSFSSGSGDRKQDGMTPDSRLTISNLTPSLLVLTMAYQNNEVCAKCKVYVLRCDTELWQWAINMVAPLTALFVVALASPRLQGLCELFDTTCASRLSIKTGKNGVQYIFAEQPVLLGTSFTQSLANTVENSKKISKDTFRTELSSSVPPRALKLRPWVS